MLKVKQNFLKIEIQNKIKSFTDRERERNTNNQTEREIDRYYTCDYESRHYRPDRLAALPLAERKRATETK